MELKLKVEILSFKKISYFKQRVQQTDATLCITTGGQEAEQQVVGNEAPSSRRANFVIFRLISRVFKA